MSAYLYMCLALAHAAACITLLMAIGYAEAALFLFSLCCVPGFV